MDRETMRAKEGHIYLIIDGEMKEIAKPVTGFGECCIKWVGGRIVEAEPTNKIRYERKK